MIPATILYGLENGVAKELARADQFADGCDNDQHHAVTCAVADTVNQAFQRRLFHGECFGAAHHDTVGNNQADKYGELFGQLISKGLEQLVNQRYQGSNNRHLHNNTDAVRDIVAYQRNEKAGKTGYQTHGNTHHDGRLKLGGNRQSRTNPQNLQGNRVVVDKG